MDEPYGPLMSPVEAEVWLGIPSSTVRTWFERRKRTGLQAEGIDHVGRPRFLLADLLVLQAGRRIWGDEGRNYTLGQIVGAPVPACSTTQGVVERSYDPVV